jgi:hypothetical protein
VAAAVSEGLRLQALLVLIGKLAAQHGAQECHDTTMNQLCIYVDVDSPWFAPPKQRIDSSCHRAYRKLHRARRALYCWTSGRADYARMSAEERNGHS